MTTSINQALRLITLWIAWLLAMLFHVDLGLMPLFHGQSPEIHSHVQEGALPPQPTAGAGWAEPPPGRATRRPTDRPTAERPARRTDRATERPADRATERPRRPTDRPTHRPTDPPTHRPTGRGW